MRLKKRFINLINKLPSVFLLLVMFSTNVVSPIYAMVDGEGDLVESSKLAETESLSFIKAPTNPTNLRFNKVYYSNLVPQLGNEVPAGSYLRKDDFDELAISFDSAEGDYYKIQMTTPNNDTKETTSLDKIEWITKSLLHPIIHDLYPGFGDLGEGEYSFRVKACKLLTCSDFSVPATLTYDNTPPTKPTWTAPENNLMTNINNVTLKWDSTDTTSGIKGYYFRYVHTSENGTITNLGTGFVSSTTNTRSGSYGRGNGKYEMYVKTVDNADNVSEESDPLTITYDGTAPDTPTGLYFMTKEGKRVECGGYSNTYYTSRHWEDIIKDSSFDHYEYSSFNAPNGSVGIFEEELTTNYRNTLSWKILAEGEYGFQVRSVDKFGNKSPWSPSNIVGIDNSCTINIDWTPPSGEILGIRYGIVDVKNFITNEKSPLLYGTYSDNNMEVEKVEVYIGEIKADVEYSQGNWTAKFTNLPEGAHEVTLKVTDKAGNTFETPEEITVDSKPPTAKYTHYVGDIEITEDYVPTVKHLSQLSFTAEYTDDVPSSGLAYDSFVIFQAQQDGSFRFSQNGAKAYCSWRKDPNRIALSGPKFSQTEKVAFTECTANLPDGEYYMAHQVYDNAVRKDNTTITQFRDVLGLHFIIDNTPEITISPSHAEVEVGSSSFEIIATVKDGNKPLTISWVGPDGFTATGDKIFFDPTTVGRFTYTAEVTDKDGDKAYESITIIVTAKPTPEPEQPTPPTEETTTVNEAGEVEGASTTDIPKTLTTNRTGRNATPLMANATEEESEMEEKEILGEEVTECNANKKLSGHIFIDKNNNNQQDDGEKGIKDVKVQIYVMENGQKKIIETITTDEEGYFETTTLCAGKYNILIEEETLPKGYAVKGEAEREIVVTEEDTDASEGAYLGVSIEDTRSFIQKYWYWILILIPIVGYIIYKKKNEDK